VPDSEGQWRIWEKPQEGKRYLMGVDTCTGEDQQLDQGLAPNPDFHSAQVWRDGYFDDMQQWHLPRLVASHHSRLEVAYLSAEIAAASSYYGNCLIVPEVNGSGLAIVKILQELHRAHVFRRRKINDSTGIVNKAFGWSTDVSTRKTIIDWLAKMILDGALDIPDPKTISELKTFIVNKKGKPEAATGLHDDRVLATAIAVFNLPHAKEYRIKPRQTLTARLLDRNPKLACPDGFMRKTLPEMSRRNASSRRSLF